MPEFFTIRVHHTFDAVPADGAVLAALAALETQLTVLGETMTKELDDLKTSVDTLVSDISQTITDGNAASAALHAALDSAVASVAYLSAQGTLDAASIADLKAQLDAAKQSATDLTTSINAADVAVKAADAGLHP